MIFELFNVHLILADCVEDICYFIPLRFICLNVVAKIQNSVQQSNNQISHTVFERPL